jgi:hypothetical protein
MVRYTHVEADDVASFVAEGHRVMCLRTGDCTGAPVPGQTACEYLVEWVVLAAEWCGAGLLFVLSGLCRLVFRSLIVVAASLVLPLVHELACVVGAVVLYPLGAAGRCLASVVERAGLNLSERSLAFGVGRRVLGVLGQGVRGRPKSATTATSLAQTPKSTAIEVRGYDA